MAITRVETSVLWTGSAYTDQIAAGGSETSLEFNLDASCVAAQITLKANATVGPAVDDQIDFYLLQTTGDPDGNAVADEFSTSGHAVFLGRVDCNVENPGLKTVQLPIPQKGGQIYATGAASGNTNPIDVSAVITEQRAA